MVEQHEEIIINYYFAECVNGKHFKRIKHFRLPFEQYTHFQKILYTFYFYNIFCCCRDDT